jgi:hypothetical protein
MSCSDPAIENLLSTPGVRRRYELVHEYSSNVVTSGTQVRQVLIYRHHLLKHLADITFQRWPRSRYQMITKCKLLQWLQENSHATYTAWIDAPNCPSELLYHTTHIGCGYQRLKLEHWYFLPSTSGF